MRDYSKNLIVFFITILSCSQIATVLISHDFLLVNPVIKNEVSTLNLHPSAFWNLSSIEIDGTAIGVGAHTWTWAESQPWCSGSGILADPYIIENVTIQGNGFSSCITIKNSNSYFTLTNSTFYDAVDISYAGIELNNVSNAYITNNTCYDNYLGIKVLNSKDNLLEGNVIKDNNDGIFIDFCEKNIVSDNIVDNNRWGIYLGYCINNIVKNNSLINNLYGIYLFRSIFNNITGNDFSNNDRCVVDLEGEGNVYENNGDCIVYYGEPFDPFFLILSTTISISLISIACITFLMVRTNYFKKRNIDRSPKRVNLIVISASAIAIIIILLIFLTEILRLLSYPL